MAGEEPTASWGDRHRRNPSIATVAFDVDQSLGFQSLDASAGRGLGNVGRFSNLAHAIVAVFVHCP